MKMLSAKAKCNGFTLIEVLAVIALLAFLAAILLPALADRGHKTNTMVRCMSDQKQITIGFIMWNSDNGNRFPWQVSATNSGALEAADRGYAAANFLCISSYVRMPGLFICPTDTNRTQAMSFAQFNNLNLSYFVSLDAATNASDGILIGDRHLADGGKPVNPGLFVASSGSKMGWTSELHYLNSRPPLGVLSFDDGHAQVVKNQDLSPAFLRENLATNRLDIP